MKKQNFNQTGNKLLTAVSLILIGVLFIIYKGEIVSIAMSVIGVTLMVLGAIDLLHKFTVSGISKIVFGVLVLAAGWLFLTLALYVLGAFLLIAGISELLRVLKVKIKKVTLGYVMNLIQPAVYILVAICLFFNQGGAISWVFTVSGIFLIIDGVVALVGALDKK